MFEHIESLVASFEKGNMSRRELVARLGACVAIASGGKAALGDGPPAEPTFKARELNHVALRVTDVGRARDFYRKHLGLSVLHESGRSCFMRCGGHFLALFQGEQAGLDHYCYTIDDYRPAQAVAALKAAGLQPRRHENRVYFDDADGLTVQVAAPENWDDWE